MVAHKGGGMGEEGDGWVGGERVRWVGGGGWGRDGRVWGRGEGGAGEEVGGKRWGVKGGEKERDEG